MIRPAAYPAHPRVRTEFTRGLRLTSYITNVRIRARRSGYARRRRQISLQISPTNRISPLRPVGSDNLGVFHRLSATDKAAADISQMPQLLHGQEREVFGNPAYWKEADRQVFQACGGALSIGAPALGR